MSNTFKTVGSQKHVEDTLMPSEAQAMDSYVVYRSELLGVRKHKYAFVGPTGRQLTGSDIADMFQRLTNVRLLCNVRRKATITWALSQPDMDRESLARLCRHSQAQQLRVYDQRSNDVRTGPVLESIEGLVAHLGKKRNDEPEVEVMIGDIIRFQSCGDSRIGKVVDKSLISGRQELTVLTMIEETIQNASHLKPIFGDEHLLSQSPIYEDTNMTKISEKLISWL